MKTNHWKKSTLRCTLGLMGVMALAACHDKGTSTRSEDGFVLVETEIDSTRYGLFLRGSKDSIQWISEEGDTAWITTSCAQIFGEPEYGDRLAAVFHDGSAKELNNLIDITQLLGRWVEPDAVDEGMMQGIELQDGGAAISINSRANRYVSWRLYNGKLLLVNSLDGMVDNDMPEDTFYIQSLTKKELKVITGYAKHIYRHSKDASEDNIKDYEEYLSPDATAFDPEGDAPEGSSPDIPEEDRLY